MTLSIAEQATALSQELATSSVDLEIPETTAGQWYPESGNAMRERIIALLKQRIPVYERLDAQEPLYGSVSNTGGSKWMLRKLGFERVCGQSGGHTVQAGETLFSNPATGAEIYAPMSGTLKEYSDDSFEITFKDKLGLFCEKGKAALYLGMTIVWVVIVYLIAQTDLLPDLLVWLFLAVGGSFGLASDVHNSKRRHKYWDQEKDLAQKNLQSNFERQATKIDSDSNFFLLMAEQVIREEVVESYFKASDLQTTFKKSIADPCDQFLAGIASSEGTLTRWSEQEDFPGKDAMREGLLEEISVANEIVRGLEQQKQFFKAEMQAVEEIIEKLKRSADGLVELRAANRKPNGPELASKPLAKLIEVHNRTNHNVMREIYGQLAELKTGLLAASNSVENMSKQLNGSRPLQLTGAKSS